MAKAISSLAVGAYTILTLASVVFVARHDKLVRDRYTDVWWNIAIADEYNQNGVFGKDPFLQNGPPFPQFNLMDWVVAKVSQISGRPTIQTYVDVLAVNAGLFLVCGFLAGFFVRRRGMDGVVCGMVTLLTLSVGFRASIGVINMGMPFYLALSMLFAWLSWMLFPPGGDVNTAEEMINQSLGRLTFPRSLLLGCVLGIIFAIHAFVGLAGFGALCVLGAAALWTRSSKKANRMLNLGSAFLAMAIVAWPWFRLQMRVQPLLKQYNAHLLIAASSPGENRDARILLLAGLALCALALLDRSGGFKRRAATLVLLLIGILLALLWLNPLNDMVARSTSSYMSSRLPQFLPIGLIVIAPGLLAVKSLRALALVLVTAGLLLLAFRFARLHYYLARTHQYDHEPYAFLREALGPGWRGKTILSDPYTSYYLRGYVGCYVLTVPSGEGNPAVNHYELEQSAKAAMLNGLDPRAASKIDAVVVEKQIEDLQPGDLISFADVTPARVIAAWHDRFGWDVRQSPEAVILTPKAP